MGRPKFNFSGLFKGRRAEEIGHNYSSAKATAEAAANDTGIICETDTAALVDEAETVELLEDEPEEDGELVVGAVVAVEAEAEAEVPLPLLLEGEGVRVGCASTAKSSEDDPDDVEPLELALTDEKASAAQARSTNEMRAMVIASYWWVVCLAGRAKASVSGRSPAATAMDLLCVCVAALLTPILLDARSVTPLQT